MSISRTDAVSRITHFYKFYIAPIKDNDEYVDLLIKISLASLDEKIENGKSPAAALAEMTHGLVSWLVLLTKIIPISQRDIADSVFANTYADRVDPAVLVKLFHPTADAATTATITQAVKAGFISNTDFVGGMLDIGRTEKAPTAERLLDAIYSSGNGNPPLPALDLALPGVTDAQTEFLIGIYVAAFNRAPEHGGLKYWAGDLARLLAGGSSEADAMKQMAKAMYVSGAKSGEQGTALPHADYVSFVYKTVLGREADAGGAKYWTDELNGGADRSHFVSVFLTSALRSSGDSDYVKARIAVAEHAAQAHVSGPGAKIDLQALLVGVADAGDAYVAIQSLPTSPPPAPATTLTSALAFAKMGSADGHDVDLWTFGASASASPTDLRAFGAPASGSPYDMPSVIIESHDVASVGTAAEAPVDLIG